MPRLWASRRIGALTRQIRIEGATPGLVEEVRSLGLRYGILTEYTSYLVQEPRAAWNQPAPMPASAALRGGAAGAAQQTGRDAFANAKASAALGGVTTLDAADHVALERAAELAAAAPGRSEVRRVGGRLFVQSDGVWTDAAYRDSLKVVEVAPFSDAYFALVRALPEIAPCLSVGDRVVVAGRHGGVKIVASGRTTWRPGELETLVRAFRGV